MHCVPPAVRSVLDAYVRLLRAQFVSRVERVVLFGSYARGQAKPDSDVDVLVVIDALGPGSVPGSAAPPWTSPTMPAASVARRRR